MNEIELIHIIREKQREYNELYYYVLSFTNKKCKECMDSTMRLYYLLNEINKAYINYYKYLEEQKNNCLHRFNS